MTKRDTRRAPAKDDAAGAPLDHIDIDAERNTQIAQASFQALAGAARNNPHPFAVTGQKQGKNPGVGGCRAGKEAG